MKTGGVVIDDWKLPIFKRHLTGPLHHTAPGITQGIDARVQ